MPTTVPSFTTEVAKRFVELVLKYDKKEWQTTFALPAQEMAILFGTVLEAGFEVKEVVVGKLVGHHRDQDGSSTGETYPINCVCPFKVVAEEGENHFKATGWLDDMLQRVLAAPSKEGREQLIEQITVQIEESVPLAPIQLTLEGDLLREYPSTGHKHARDKDNFGSGVHEHCNGWMDRHRATEKCDTIVCRSCHLRVYIPREVKTYGDLREAMETSLLVQRNQRFPGRGEPRYR